MAVSPSPSLSLDVNLQISDHEKSLVSPMQLDHPSTASVPSSSAATAASSSSAPMSVDNPNTNQNPALMSQVAPSIQVFPPVVPSFRPVVPAPMPPSFSQVQPNPNFQNQGIQPPGVSGAPISVPLVGSTAMYATPLRPYPQMPNGFVPAPGAPPLPVPPPGIPRYPGSYPTIVRPPVFPPRPPGIIGVAPPLTRPPIPGIRGVPPMVAPGVRPGVPIAALPEKPQTTVYVGKIAPTVENDFLLSLLQLCGPVKSWKRAQDPSDGSPRGFGFCEFESAEGVLRALRLLSKLNVDGQELVLNVNQATREYLERYVEKKTEREKKLKEGEAEGTLKEDENAPGVEKLESSKSSVDESKSDATESVNRINLDPQRFGIVTEEDEEADKDAMEKLTNIMEDRIKNKPPPPPPAQSSAPEVSSRSKDGDSDVDIMKSDAAEETNDEETTSENKPANEQDKVETTSSDKSRHYDRKSRDRERDLKRDKERELERYERERERERVRREREREMRFREAERVYKERVKEWELRERDKEYQRQHEKDREKEKERNRRREIKDQEDESDDEDTRKRRRRSSTYEERRKKRQREKEEDMSDRSREEEEIAEAKRKAFEEKAEVVAANNGSEKPGASMVCVELRENTEDQASESDSGHTNNTGDMVSRNSYSDEMRLESSVTSDMRLNNSVPTRRLGFGLVGSGKRTTVPSVFHEEDEEEGEKEKRMRPLVPIDYSAEELQAVQAGGSAGGPPNLAAAAEFAKRISNGKPKDDKVESDRERNRRSNRERDRNAEDSNRGRDENKDKLTESKKLLDAKQLIDMIPKTKEELFSYEINWAVYDKHELHERMRPWISKKITEFLGEEETTLVDYIVSSTKEHVKASQMLELLQSILDDEAEMFVLKMWRMLIFEIKKVETGLSLKPRA